MRSQLSRNHWERHPQAQDQDIGSCAVDIGQHGFVIGMPGLFVGSSRRVRPRCLIAENAPAFVRLLLPGRHRDWPLKSKAELRGEFAQLPHPVRIRDALWMCWPQKACPSITPAPSQKKTISA